MLEADNVKQSYLLVGNYRLDAQESMGRYALLMESLLQRRMLSVRLIRPFVFFGFLGATPSGVGKYIGYVDKYLLFPLALWIHLLVKAMRGTVIVHVCDHSNALYVLPFLKSRIRWVVTCHDVMAMTRARSGQVGLCGRTQQYAIERGIERAHAVVCVSMHTRDRLLALLDLDCRSVFVAYNCLNYPYVSHVEPSVIAGLWQRLQIVPPASYIFHVGGNQWYKNRVGLVRIYSQLCRRRETVPALVMAGQQFTVELIEAVSAVPSNGRIINVGTVTNLELNALYANAMCFCFPSIQEGFGWPVIEAMASSCLVVTTDRVPLTEVGGGAAFYADVDNEATFVDAICMLLDSSLGDRRKWLSAGFIWVKRFSYESMLGDVRQAYAFSIDNTWRSK